MLGSLARHRRDMAKVTGPPGKLFDTIETTLNKPRATKRKKKSLHMIKLLENFYRVAGIDLGTANSLIYVKGRGIVVDQPTLVAVNNRTEQILAIGDEAKKMLDRVPAHVTLIQPLMNGVISDFGGVWQCQEIRS